MIPRFLHRWYAAAAGYGWRPCPLCGAEFGGHEWKDRGGKVSHIPTGEPGCFRAICPDCTRAGRGQDGAGEAEAPGLSADAKRMREAAQLTEVYRERTRLVAWLAALYPSALVPGADGEEPDWAVLFITLPTGQVSWHIAADDWALFHHVDLYDTDTPGVPEWDGHTTAEKYERIAAHVRAVTGPCDAMSVGGDRPEPGEGSPGDIGLGPLPSFSAPPAGPPCHYGDNGDEITGKHTGRVEDCTGPGCGPAYCGDTRETGHQCARPPGHPGVHYSTATDGRSYEWPRGTVSVPRDALRGLVEVALCVNARPQPRGHETAAHFDARRALAALDDAGLLDQFREDGNG